MKPNIKKLLPGIQDYLESVTDKKSVSSQGLDELIYRICAKTGLKKEISALLVSLLFSEIRNAMLRGDIVSIRELGNFYIKSPSNSKNKIRVFPKFKPYKNLLKRMNDIK